MPMPKLETLRVAVEDAVRRALEAEGQRGDLFAVVDKKEIGFRPSGTFSILVFDEEAGEDEEVEKTFRFEVQVVAFED